MFPRQIDVHSAVIPLHQGKAQNILAWSGPKKQTNKHHHSMWLVTASTLKYPFVHPYLVSEPDPRKIEKDSGKLGGIEVYTVEC